MTSQQPPENLTLSLWDDFRSAQPECPQTTKTSSKPALQAPPSDAPSVDKKIGEVENIENTENPEEIEQSAMSPEAKRALVTLLKSGVILASQKARLFETICKYRAAFRAHLADVYLKLVLDEKAGIAFVSQMTEVMETDDEVSPLITCRTLTLYDTLLLLVLRKHYQEREMTGEQSIILDMERMEAGLSPFLPLTNSSRADRKTLLTAIKRMQERNILQTVRGEEERFEISPLIRYIVNAAFLENLLTEYLRLANEQEA